MSFFIGGKSHTVGRGQKPQLSMPVSNWLVVCSGVGLGEGEQSAEEAVGDRQGDRVHVARPAGGGEAGVHGRIRGREGKPPGDTLNKEGSSALGCQRPKREEEWPLLNCSVKTPQLLVFSYSCRLAAFKLMEHSRHIATYQRHLDGSLCTIVMVAPVSKTVLLHLFAQSKPLICIGVRRGTK